MAETLASPSAGAAAPAPSSPARSLWRRLRSVLFWTHLAIGCLAGLVIAFLCVTGVLLTYERQLLASAEATRISAAPASEHLSLSELTERVDFDVREISVSARPGAPVRFSAGRRSRVELDVATGEVVPDAAPALREFFSTVTALHRWFAFDGDARDRARHVTGAANLGFLVLMLTGLFVWLPPLLRGPLLRTRLLFSRRYVSAKARDYGWHHVIGIWCLVPLFLIALTGTVFHYDWSADALRTLVARDASPMAAQAPGRAPAAAPETEAVFDPDALFALAFREAPSARRVTLTVPEPGATSAHFVLDFGNGAQVQKQETLVVSFADSANGADRADLAVLERGPRLADDPYRHARFVVRFLHTGEIFDVPGQTVAGIASLGGAVLAWTGIALAWRRLVLPSLRRRRAAA